MPTVIVPVSALSRAIVGTGWNTLAYWVGIAWLSPTSRPHRLAARAARASSIRYVACSTTSEEPIGRSVNASGGAAAAIA